jgi:Nucleotidyl transferase AbiEii toxin, Type IV TA system
MPNSAREEYLIPGRSGLDTAITISERYPQLFAGRKFMERETIKDVLRRFNEKGIRYCLVGGLALAHHSIPRVTQYVDMLVLQEDVPKVTVLLKGQELRGTSMALIFKVGETRFDIIPANLQAKRAAVLNAIDDLFEGETIKVANLRDMIFLKLWAASERQERRKKLQDEVDIVGLIELNPSDVSKEDIAHACRTLLAMAYTPGEMKKYRVQVEWLNSELDKMGMSDRKFDLPA